MEKKDWNLKFGLLQSRVSWETWRNRDRPCLVWVPSFLPLTKRCVLIVYVIWEVCPARVSSIASCPSQTNAMHCNLNVALGLSTHCSCQPSLRTALHKTALAGLTLLWHFRATWCWKPVRKLHLFATWVFWNRLVPKTELWVRKGTRCSCAQNNHMSRESISTSADPQLVYILFDVVLSAPI